jgi:hypothetical protein
MFFEIQDDGKSPEKICEFYTTVQNVCKMASKLYSLFIWQHVIFTCSNQSAAVYLNFTVHQLRYTAYTINISS